MLTGKVTRGSRWTDRAVHYAEEFDWQIVPISTTSRAATERATDPVVRQLGASILVEHPEEATSDPESIEELGTQLPSARIGAVTGEDSNLLAVEVSREAGPVPDRIERLAGDARRVVGPSREYLLFRHPEVTKPLPTLTEAEGAILHGEESVVFVPWRQFEWGLDSGEGMGTAEPELLSLFGVADHLPGSDRVAEQTAQRDAQHDTLAPFSSSAGPDMRETTLPFRSGTELQSSPEEEGYGLDLPWTVPGGLSVLTGRPKTSGKSTWAVNLAAHLAAGASFLGVECAPSEVVMLTDLPPAPLRTLLQHIEDLDEEALSRLHLAHRRDVQELNWVSTLQRAYEQVATVNADLLIVDSLPSYIQLKGGNDPRHNEDVVHMLTVDGPDACPVLAVQHTDCTPREPLSRTADRLGLLGTAADALLRIEAPSRGTLPHLRRLQTVRRSADAPSTCLYTLRDRQCERVHPNDLAELGPDDEPIAPEDLLSKGPGPNPLLSS